LVGVQFPSARWYRILRICEINGDEKGARTTSSGTAEGIVILKTYSDAHLTLKRSK
jgi:hypothetical protein